MPWKINPDTGELDYYEASTGGGGGGSTNLSFVPGVSNGTVVSDSGTDATILAADATNAGLMLPTEKTKLAGIAVGAEVNVNADWLATSGDALILNKPSSLPTANVKHSVKYAEALTKGQAVYVSGADGTNMLVSKASNATEATSSKTLGLVTASGAANYQGEVITEGLLAGLDTSTATIGDAVWLGTNGNLIFWHYGLTTKPVAPAHLVFIGIVTRVNANNGEIFVKPQNGFEIDELHDVLITNPQDGDVLIRDNTGLWKNVTPPFVTGSGTAKYVPVFTDGKVVGNSVIYEDAGKIGVGTATPHRKFHVKENAFALALEGTDHVYQEFYPQGIAAGRFGFIGYSQAGSGIFRFYNGPLGTDIDFVTDNVIRLVIKKAGQIVINTINPATTDTDKFLVSDAGEIKYRTGAEMLSDIGAQGSLSLTTTGTSGAATLVGNTLNIPQYSGGGAGGSETLAQTLALGNSAGTNDINMNNRSITNINNVSTSATTVQMQAILNQTLIFYSNNC